MNANNMVNIGQNDCLLSVQHCILQIWTNYITNWYNLLLEGYHKYFLMPEVKSLCYVTKQKKKIVRSMNIFLYKSTLWDCHLGLRIRAFIVEAMSIFLNKIL